MRSRETARAVAGIWGVWAEWLPQSWGNCSGLHKSKYGFRKLGYWRSRKEGFLGLSP